MVWLKSLLVQLPCLQTLQSSSVHPLTLLFPSPRQLRARKAKRAQQYKQLLAKRAREEAKLQARVRKEKKEFYQLLGKEQQRHQQAMAAS